MSKLEYASPESQLLGGPCEVEESEEMFWLRQNDDYQSHVRLGNLLVGQYRYRDAISAYKQAEKIRDDEAILYLRMGGAALSVFDYEMADVAYKRAEQLGVPAKTMAFYRGMRCYLSGDYQGAIMQLQDALPNNPDMTASILYWQSMAGLKTGQSIQQQLTASEGVFSEPHRAYCEIMEFLSGKITSEQLANRIAEASDLDAVILLYGRAVYLASVGDTNGALMDAGQVMTYQSVWPSIPWLAAWRERG